MIGNVISHYRIFEKLGQGGMGVIYKAEDLKLKRIVAIKFLPESLTQDEESKLRFINEAQAASSLQHNNICTIHEVDETRDGKLFIVMDFYEGESLKEKISRGQLDIEEATDIAFQAANGLRQAHEKGILHRDIKPANIFITNNGVVKILDFGLAKFTGNQAKLTKTGSTLGTLSYMSPEQIIGGEADNRTDIWSLGVVLYEMLTGLPPFKGEYEAEVLYSVMNEEPEFISRNRNDAPIKLEQIVDKALNKNRDKRFRTTEEMLNELQIVCDEFKSGTIKKSSPFLFLSKRQRRTINRILIAVLVLVIAFVTFLWQNRVTKAEPAYIALMPLKSISANAEQEWFTDGMTDALITSLAKIGGLKVISRSSVMKYKNSDKSPTEIANELGVSYLIESSVIRIGDKIKISARLINAKDNNYIWAQEYKRDYKNVLSLQSELAGDIAGNIQVKLTPYEQKLLSDKPPVNPEAYDAYLKGNFNWYKLTPQSLETALKYYELAVQLDSGYALGYAGIALVWIGRAQNGYIPYTKALKEIKPVAAKALKLDSTLAEVHYTLGTVKAWGEWKWQQSANEFEKAIKINPNFAEARISYSHLLFYLNRPEEGMNQIKQALKLDPFNSLFQGFYAMDLMFARRFDDAIKVLEKILLIAPHDPIALSTLKSAYHQEHLYKKALEVWRISFEASGDREAVDLLNKGNAEGGYSAALKKIAELMIQRSKTRFVTPWQIATLYTRAGMNKEALDWLEKAYDAHDPNMPYLSVDPIFDKIRDNTRFKMLIKKMGLES